MPKRLINSTCVHHHAFYRLLAAKACITSRTRQMRLAYSCMMNIRTQNLCWR
jgi:hypothetical protein